MRRRSATDAISGRMRQHPIEPAARGRRKRSRITLVFGTLPFRVASLQGRPVRETLCGGSFPAPYPNPVPLTDLAVYYPLNTVWAADDRVLSGDNPRHGKLFPPRTFSFSLSRSLPNNLSYFKPVTARVCFSRWICFTP